MKIIKTLFKTIEQKSKLDLITELLIVGNSTEEVLSLFNKAKANVVFEMNKRESQMKKDISLIRSITPAREYDANFDKPLSEIETNFEIVTPN